MRTVLFINANSRRARRLAVRVAGDFQVNPGPFDVVETIVVKKLSKMDTHLERLKSIKDIDCVIVGSGDGTIITVINALQAHKNLVFGFLPLGTGNAFVRSLGLPVTYPEAMAILKQQYTRKITLGEANGILIANMAALGLSARMAGRISDTTKKYFGQVAFAITTLRLLATHTSFACDFKYDGKRKKFHSHQLVIANGKYHGPRPISQKASVYNDHLVLVAFGTNQSRLGYLISTIRFLLGIHESHNHTEIIPFKKGSLTTRPVRSVETDGEITTKTPLNLSVKPRIITVLAGQEAS